MIQAMGFHEVQQYLNLTGHIQSSVQILINDRVWERLKPEQREALREAIRELGGEVRDGLERSEVEILERWREGGQLTIVDDVDVEAFRDRARSRFVEGFPFSELYRRVTGAKGMAGPPPTMQAQLGRGPRDRAP
jgi:TRAP-type transport system periplasmic protein